MVADQFWVWIEPAGRLYPVSAATYQKLVEMKIWDHPQKLVILNKNRRALRLQEIDPFPSMDKYFEHARKVLQD